MCCKLIKPNLEIHNTTQKVIIKCTAVDCGLGLVSCRPEKYKCELQTNRKIALKTNTRFVYGNCQMQYRIYIIIAQIC